MDNNENIIESEIFMKKKIYFLIMTMILLVSFVGCSNEVNDNNDKNIDEETMFSPSIPIPVVDYIYDTPTPQKDKYGAKGLCVYEFLNKIENKDSFFLYVEMNENDNKDIIDAISWGFENKNIVLSDFIYIINFSSLNEKEQETLLTYVLPGTVYCFENGELKNSFIEIPSPEIENYTDEFRETFETWIYSSMICVDYHQMQTITLEEIVEKSNNKEEFMVYVGRESCKYCRAFTPVLEKYMQDYSQDIPIYYFYTQEYKNGILAEEDGSQELWDKAKETIGIQYTPSFIYFGNFGENEDKLEYSCKYFDSFIGKEYFEANDEEKDKLILDCFNLFVEWLKNECSIENKEKDISSDIEECDDMGHCL